MLSGKEPTGKKNIGLYAVFLACMAMANYFQIGYASFQFAGINIMYSGILHILIILMGICAFLVTPNFARLRLISGHLLLILSPTVFSILWSHIIWIADGAGFTEMRRGYSDVLYLLLGICAIAAFVYIYGETAAWWYLASLLIANSAIALEAILQGGAAAFFRDFFQLLVTFADDTSQLMADVEINGITYAMGLYLVFLLMCAKKTVKLWQVTVTVLFFFLLGLKRIAVVAAVLAVLAGLVCRFLSKVPEAKRFLLKVAGAVFLAFILAYVGAVYYGLYDYLESVGLDTSSRNIINRFYRDYYTFSPSFLGKGIGWVTDIVTKARAVNSSFKGTHNEYVRAYIELGMIGYLIWAYLGRNLQISYSYRKLGDKEGDLSLSLVVYIAIIHMTDTVYVYTHMAFAAIMMCQRFAARERVKQDEMEEKNRWISEEGYMPKKRKGVRIPNDRESAGGAI